MPRLPPLCKSNSRPVRSGFLLILALIVLCAAAKAILYDTLDPDCFWHLRVGEQLWREGVGPLRDGIAFASMREPWTPYSWLAEMGMSWLWDVGGLRAAVLAAAMLGGGTILMIALSAWEALRGALDDGAEDAVTEQGRLLAAIIAAAFAAVWALPYFSFRPVTLAFFLLAVAAWLVFRDRRMGERSRGVWAVAPIAALMTNVHFFAFLVPASLGTLLAGAVWERATLIDPVDRRDANRCVGRYAVLMLASLLACLMTPMLPGVIATIGHYQWRDPMVASNVIGEMRPFWSGAAGKISLALVGVLVLCVARRHRRLRAGEFCWLLLAAALLMRMGRMAPVFAIVAAPLLAVTMPKLSDGVLGRPVLRLAGAMVLCLGLWRVGQALPGRNVEVDAWLNRHGVEAPGYPGEAARFVAMNVPRASGRIVNEFNWGGYLGWRLGTQYQVMLDGRTQVFAPSFWKQTYLGDEAGRRRLLAGTGADAAVLPVGKSLFKSSLVGLGWKTVYQDARAEVLVPPAGGGVAGVE